MKSLVVCGVALAALALQGCSSSRFNSYGGPTGSERFDGPTAQSRMRQPAPPSDDLVDGGRGLGSGAVTSQPLDGQMAAIPPVNPSLPPVSTPVVPPASAIAPAVGAAPAAPAIARSSSPAGTWKVTDAGSTCRITLSTQALFELYRANPQGCTSPSLAKVNAWESRGNEVVLFEPGGKVAARLFSQGDGQYSGATARGATMTMSR